MMPKCYAITCHQMPWRIAAAQQRLLDAGLDVELFDGIHGASFGLAPTLDYFDSPGHRINAGKVGLCLSKLLVWTWAAARADDPVLIFEDDVVFAPNFCQEFAKSYASLPPDWQVCHVGHCCSDDKPTTRINDRISIIRTPMCCHAVLWRRDALPYAIAQLKRAACNCHSDVTLAQIVYPNLKHYCFTPPLAFQDKSPSEACAATTWDKIAGWCDFERLYTERLDHVHKSAVFVEVGCWQGKSTAYMAQEIKRRLKPVTFYAVDTWKGTEGHEHQAEVAKLGGDMFPTWQRNMSRCGVIDYVIPLQMSSLEAAVRFKDRSLDFVFIDGDHSFDAVVADIRAWRPKIKPGVGVLAGHDIDREDVRRAVEQELGKGKFRTWERCWIAT